VIVDSHAHLEMEPLLGDIEGVLGRARLAGVTGVVTVATTPEDLPVALELARRYPGTVTAAAGCHPHEARRITAIHLDALLRAAPSLAAIGETGLDYYRMHSPKEDQIRLCGQQLDLASEAGKPVIIHLRDDQGDFLRLFGDRLARLRGVVHCFSGELATAKRFVDAGWFISIPGTITFKADHPLRAIATALPLSSLLVETDAPYLAPIPFRGKRNEPAYLVETVKAVAAARGEAFETVAAATAGNAHRLFGVANV
jgi:TatD DNase family protein